MSDFLTALGLAFVIEGVLYALFPGPMRRIVERLTAEPERTLRLAGLGAAAAGVGLVWLVRAG